MGDDNKVSVINSNSPLPFHHPVREKHTSEAEQELGVFVRFYGKPVALRDQCASRLLAFSHANHDIGHVLESHLYFLAPLAPP